MTTATSSRDPPTGEPPPEDSSSSSSSHDEDDSDDFDEETVSMEEFRNEEEETVSLEKSRDPPSADPPPRHNSTHHHHEGEEGEEETVSMEDISNSEGFVFTNMPDFPEDSDDNDRDDEDDTNTTNARANIVNGPIVIQIDQRPQIPVEVPVTSTSSNRYGTLANSVNRSLQNPKYDRPIQWCKAALLRVLQAHVLFGIFLVSDAEKGFTHNERVANLCGFVFTQIAVLSFNTLIWVPEIARCDCIEGAMEASDDGNNNKYGACQMKGDDDVFFLSLQSNDTHSYIKPEWLEEFYNVAEVDDTTVNATGCSIGEAYNDVFQDILLPSCQITCPSTAKPTECSAEKVCCYAYYNSRGSGRDTTELTNIDTCPLEWYLQVIVDQLIATMVSLLVFGPAVSWLLAKESARFNVVAYTLIVIQIALGVFLLVAAMNEVRFSSTTSMSSSSILWPILTSISLGLFVTSIIMGLLKETLMATVKHIKGKQQQQQIELEDGRVRQSSPRNNHQADKNELFLDEMEQAKQDSSPNGAPVAPSSPTETTLTGTTAASIERQHVLVLGTLITFIVCGVALLAGLVAIITTLVVTSANR